MDWENQGRSLGRGRARGSQRTPQEAVPFFQRRGIGIRHLVSTPSAQVAVKIDEVINDPDITGGRVEPEAIAKEESNSPNGNDNGDSSEEDASISGEASSSHDEEIATTRRKGRGIRPDILDYVVSRPAELDTKQGSSGSRINLVANYFQLQHKKQWALRQYRVDVKPEEDQTRVRKQLVKQHQDNFPAFIFDGTMLITYGAMSMEPLVLNSEYNGTNYIVEIRYIKEFVSGDPMTFQFYNLVVRKTLQELNLDLLGRHYYDSTLSIAMPNWRLELWPGYMTSMRRCEDEVLLNVDVTHKMIRNDSVLDLMESVKRNTRDEHEIRAKITQQLVGRIVMTRYNRKTYRIDGIHWDKHADGTFPKKVGDVIEQMTFQHYYRTKYQIELTAKKQPLLISIPRQRTLHDRRGDQGPISLIPELCHITGLDEDQRANFMLMKDMSQHLHMVPEKRANTLTTFMDRIRNTKVIQEDMARWGVRFLPDLVKVPGRVLASEKIKFGEGGEQEFKADWSQAFRTQKLFSTPELGTWCLIVPQRCDGGIDNLIQKMKLVSSPLGYRMSPPEVVRIPQDRPQAYIEAVNNVMSKHRDKIQMIFVVLPHSRLELYSAVKKRISVDFGIPSQFFLAKNVGNKGLMTITTKVVIQMCAKQGGEPWCVTNPLKNLMVVGFDVHHSVGRKEKSVGAMVSTYSNSLARYFSTISYFSTQDEMAENMELDILKCLNAYKRMNGCYPGKIMFYRDGVGEGQLNYVFSSELEQMKLVVGELYKKDGLESPKLTFVVVNKKINARLFNYTNRVYENPPAGTVVDSVITLPERYDFFLVPQSVRQGTVSSCSYNVLYDSSGLPADKVQIFTFKLCHLYYNWSGTVGVPAPCQYAHKLAKLTGMSLGSAVSQRLQFLLHYL